MKHVIAASAAALFFGAVNVAAQTKPASPAPSQGAPVAPAASSITRTLPMDYVIGPGDVLEVAYRDEKDMTGDRLVRPDGKISLPLLNDIQAGGLTPMELRETLVKKLTDFMPTPEVSVIVVDPKSFKVSVIGEVLKPARYELKSRTSVLDVLALAGGFTQFAARNQIVILRPNGKTMTRIPFNYNRLVSSRDGLLDKIVNSGVEQENFYLRNGDIVLVP